MGYFWWLLSMSIDLALFAWPITVLLVVALAGSVIQHVRRRDESHSVSWAEISVGIVFTLVILLAGTIWSATGPNWTPRSGARFVQGFIVFCLVAQVLVVSVLTWRARKARALTATIGALQVWWSIGASFIASMSVSGNWL
jgi:hypothetical protein